MLNKNKCERKISYSKEERPSFQSRIWWAKLFKKLEDEASIPPEKRLEILEKLFPNHVLRNIVDVIDLDENDKKKIRGLITTKFPCEGPLTDPPIYNKIYVPKGEKDISTSSYSFSSSISSSSRDRTPLSRVGKSNPYLKFFRTRHDRASIWRPMPPLSLTDMNLEQRAEAITERIAEGFVKWLHQMGGESPSNLTVATIISMFEIGFNTHAAKSLSVRLKELPTVTDLMAKKRNVPQMAKRASLLRQIHMDIEANKQKPRRIAFGKYLPSYMQKMPNKEDIAKKWLECQNVPTNLKTMQTVWEGITHLRSTRAYCEWLVNHPEITPPEFLVENNMLDLQTLHAQRPSIEEDDLGVEELISGPSEMTIKNFSQPNVTKSSNEVTAEK